MWVVSPRHIILLVCVAVCFSVAVATYEGVHVDVSKAHKAATATKAHTQAQTHQKQHVSHRVEDTLAQRMNSDMADHARLLFRSLDHDFDKKISSDDVKKSQKVLNKHLPGVTVTEFLEFVKLADKDKDHKLDRKEFVNGLAEGFGHTDLIQVDSKAGFLGAVGKFIGNLFKKKPDPNAVGHTEDACVICQYLVERIETNVKTAGILGNFGGEGRINGFQQSFLEIEQTVTPQQQDNNNNNNNNHDNNDNDNVAFVEVQTEVSSNPVSIGSVGSISSSRQTSRYQRQMERQKFNEIYRIADITFDDVCEQGMPNTFYETCKKMYSVQSDIVDGLRYQYRPADICFRIKVCEEESYITKGLHSRYQKPKKKGFFG